VSGGLAVTKEKGMIDINTASADQIDAVPQLKGHGFEIVRYREERGRFEALRQLEEVPGMAGKVDGLDAAIGFG
jgi:DNA uptake protein ComE-like DNA-binding protein